MAAKISAPPDGVLAFTIPEFCFLGRFGRDKAYDLIKLGEIKPIKIGKRTLIPVNDARAYFRSQGLELAS